MHQPELENGHIKGPEPPIDPLARAILGAVLAIVFGIAGAVALRFIRWIWTGQ